MKTIKQTIFPISLGLIAAMPALAIEPPKDDAPPPPSVKTPASTQSPDPSKRAVLVAPNGANNANNAFIGLITADLPEMLAAHLGVKAGEGVVIRDLAPDGPAEKAGFARFDVITRVAGESVGSPAELSQRIATKKPGEEISIDLIHEGRQEVKTVQLGSRPAEAGRVIDPRQLGHLNLNDMPGEQAERLRQMIEGRLNGRMPETDIAPDAGRGNFQFNSNATIRMMDNDGSVEMKSSNGSKDITLRDHDNNVTWSGPWNSDQDKAAAPPEVRERIQRFKFDDNFRGGGLRLKLGPDGPETGTDE